MSSDHVFLQAPLPGLDAWVQFFVSKEGPVLEATADELEVYRLIEDDVTAQMLADLIAPDPLMTSLVFAHVNRLRKGNRELLPETLTACFVLTGVAPFFRAFGPRPTVEHLLQSHPEALTGFQTVLNRSRRAANFALAFAAHRMDQDAEQLHQAAILHELVEMQLWIYAYPLMEELRRRQVESPELRSGQIQTEVLGVTISDLQLALMNHWGFPELLLRLCDEHVKSDTQVHTVRLATQLARHLTLRGWNDAAIPDDVIEVAELLQLSPMAAMKLLHDIDDA